MTDPFYVSEHAVARYRQRTGTARPADEIRRWLEHRLRDAAEFGATKCIIDGIAFPFKRGRGVIAVTTAYPVATNRPPRRAPRSELSRKELHRRMRKGGKKAG